MIELIVGIIVALITLAVMYVTGGLDEFLGELDWLLRRNKGGDESDAETGDANLIGGDNQGTSGNYESNIEVEITSSDTNSLVGGQYLTKYRLDYVFIKAEDVDANPGIIGPNAYFCMGGGQGGGEIFNVSRLDIRGNKVCVYIAGSCSIVGRLGREVAAGEKIIFALNPRTLPCKPQIMTDNVLNQCAATPIASADDLVVDQQQWIGQVDTTASGGVDFDPRSQWNGVFFIDAPAAQASSLSVGDFIVFKDDVEQNFGEWDNQIQDWAENNNCSSLDNTKIIPDEICNGDMTYNGTVVHTGPLGVKSIGDAPNTVGEAVYRRIYFLNRPYRNIRSGEYFRKATLAECDAVPQMQRPTCLSTSL